MNRGSGSRIEGHSVVFQESPEVPHPVIPKFEYFGLHYNLLVATGWEHTMELVEECGQ